MPTFVSLFSPPSGGLVLHGPQGYAQIGVSVASAGDFNNDGIDDFIVTGPVTDAVNHGRGATYLIFGKAGGIGPIDLANLSAAQGFAIYGPAGGDGVDMNSAAAGDVNGDGYADIVIGAPRNNSEVPWAGRAYIVYGHASGFATLDLGTMTAAQGSTIRMSPPVYAGSNGPFIGVSVASAGDVNHDGYGDVIVGAENEGAVGNAGAAYLLFGSANGIGNVNLATLTPSQGYALHGTQASGFAGHDVTGLGDINGDGIDDFAIGIPFANSHRGSVVVRYGTTEAFAGELAPAPDQGFTIIGPPGGLLSGWSIAGAGDVNGDGFKDILVGDSMYDGQGTAYLLFGKAGGFGTIDLGALTPDQGFRIDRGATIGQIGGVAAAGDVNGDGFDDFQVGVWNASGVGAVYLFYGAASLAPVTLGVSDGLVLRSNDVNDAVGTALGAGDFNHDGFSDLLIGAWRADQANFTGEAFLVYGALPTGPVTRTGTLASQTLAGGMFDDVLNGLAGDDRLYGNGGHDDLQGGPGRDRLDGGAGSDIMAGGPGDDLYYVDDPGDLVSEQSGEGSDRVVASVDFVLPAFVEHLDLAGTAVSGTGNEADNHINGNGLANLLSGLDGNDVLAGLAGDDTLAGGAGDDVLDGGAGTDVASFAAAASDVHVDLGIAGPQDTGDGTDTLISIEGLQGSANNDVLKGDAGANGLAGGDGQDWLQGGGGADSEAGGAGHDSVWGGAGDDLLTGGPGDDTLDGGEGNDTVSYADAPSRVEVDLSWLEDQNTRGAGVDTLVSIENAIGSAYDDALTGNAGANVLTGGGGADVLTGGAGNDVFAYRALSDSTVAAPDLIVDFAHGDRIDLSALDADSATAGDQAFHLGATAGHAGDIVLVFDAASGRTAMNLYVDGDAIADATIWLAGNQLALTNADIIA